VELLAERYDELPNGSRMLVGETAAAAWLVRTLTRLTLQRDNPLTAGSAISPAR
jgi:hypothetical protein